MELSYLHQDLEEGFGFRKGAYDDLMRMGLFADKGTAEAIDMIRDVLLAKGMYGSEKVNAIRRIYKDSKKLLGKRKKSDAVEAGRNLEAMNRVLAMHGEIRRDETEAAVASLANLGRHPGLRSPRS